MKEGSINMTEPQTTILDYKPQFDPDFFGKTVYVASASRDHDFCNDSVLSFATLAASVPLGCKAMIGIESNFIHVARNIIFFKAKAAQADYLITHDSDVSLIASPGPPVGYLIKQALKYNVDMIGGVVFRNHYYNGLAPDVFNRNKDGRMIPIDAYPQGMTKVDGVGASFLFLTKRLIQAFTDEKIREFGNPFDFTHQSEDFAFCERVKKLGFEIYVDGALEFSHIKSIPLTRQLWEMNRSATTREPRNNEIRTRQRRPRRHRRQGSRSVI